MDIYLPFIIFGTSAEIELNVSSGARIAATTSGLPTRCKRLIHKANLMIDLGET